jgi:3-hydroxy acid dehydrogenase/malonic semialdehyde reductase
LETKYKIRVHPLEMDVRDFGSVEKAIKSLPTEFQAVDVLVNNAGLALGLAKAWEISFEHLSTMLDTNVKGKIFI